MLSKSCEYAVKAMLHIAHKSQLNERVGIKNIAKAIDSPEAFTAKILQQLAKKGLTKSFKGPSGGFWIDEEDRKNINLQQIVEVIDGDRIYKGCGLGLNNCLDNKPCPMHDHYKHIRKMIIKLHSEITLEELATKLDGIAFLK